jgi:DtxR family Mn-dependent transcriptional regulator
MLTIADQDYVTAIYRLQGETSFVTTSSLASALGVTPASVSGMVRKLSGSKLVLHRRHKGVRLTKSGRRAALDILRRHRLTELFLVDILGLSWDLVHREAHKLEHAISDEVLDRIDEMLKLPKYDPHGSPIPSRNGEIASRSLIRLNQMDVGSKGTVREVSDDDPEMLNYLSRVGMIPGAPIAVKEVFPFDGVITLQVGKRKQTVSPKVASAVWIDLRT